MQVVHCTKKTPLLTKEGWRGSRDGVVLPVHQTPLITKEVARQRRDGVVNF